MDEGNKDLLGCIGRDNLSGFEGLVYARTDYMYGCSRYHIQPIKLKDDGSIGDIETFDVQRIICVKEAEAGIQIVRSKMEFGNQVRDLITNIEGIVTGITTYLYGETPSITIEQKRCAPDGSPAKSLFFHEPRIVVVGKDKPKCEQESKRPGGPREGFRQHRECR
jgi:hypothetical protein